MKTIFGDSHIRSSVIIGAIRLVIIALAILVVSGGILASPGPHCVILQWTAPGDDGTVGQASLYDIRYSTQPIDQANFYNATQVDNPDPPLPSGTTQFYTISGLESETEYYFAIRTMDESFNWSPISNVISRTTMGDICTGMSGNVDCDPEDKVTVADLTALASYLFGGSTGCICLSEANVDGSLGGGVNIADISFLAKYLFGGGSYPAWCP